MKTKILCLLLLVSMYATAQVGIGTTDPKAVLDIKSTNQANPSSKDGMLVPKIDTFPATNPGLDQQGMLVYLTTTVGANAPGFYYWNNPTTAWIPIGNNSNSGWNLNGNSGTDDTVNFIGTTDNEDVVFKRNNVPSGKIDDILTSFGLNALENNASNGFENSAFGIDALATNTVGKENSAFGFHALRANIGGESNSAFGRNSLRSNTTGISNSSFGNLSLFTNTTGSFNSAFGSFALRSNLDGANNVAFGYQSQLNTTSGQSNSSFGQLALSANTTGGFNTAIGRQSLTTNTTGGLNTALGALSNVSSNGLTNATAIGARALVGADNSLVLGSINGINGATSNVNVGIGTTTPLDKLHVVGNIRMVDGNEAAGSVLTSDTNGTASWTDLSSVSSGTLDQAYDFGGAGNGRTITADTGAVLIDGTDGLVSTGTSGSGAIAPSGAGVKMFWNPRKAAFRAGNANSTEWDDANIGQFSTAFGSNSTASGNSSFAGSSGSASGNFSFAFGNGATASLQSSIALGNFANASSTDAVAIGFGTTASGTKSTAFGTGTTASGVSSTAFGSGTTASGNTSTAFGQNNTASGTISTAFGFGNTATSSRSTAFGSLNIASGINSTAYGIRNTSPSFAETVIGIGATNYTPSTNGSVFFGAANVTDRLFVIGNAIDINNNDSVDDSERSDAMVILKNGNTGIGTSTPQDKLHVEGNIRMVDGNEATGKVLTSDSNGTATWQNASANAWGLTGNSGTNPATNFIGTTDATNLTLRTNNIQHAVFTDTGKTFFGDNVPLSDNWANLSKVLIGSDTDINDLTLRSSGTDIPVFNILRSNGTMASPTVFSSGELGSIRFWRYTGTGGFDGYIPAGRIMSGVTASGTGLAFSASGGSSTTGMMLLSTGEVGIGTSTPSRKLHIVDGTTGVTPFTGAPFVVESSADAYQQFLTPNTSATIGSGLLFGTPAGAIRGGVVFGALAEKLDFRTGNNTRMTILNNGLVGVGTITPVRLLHVSNGASGGTSNVNTGILLESGTNMYQHFLTPSTNEKGLLFGSELATIQGGIIFNSTNSTNGLLFRTGGNVNRMTITDTGDVGITTLTPSQRFDVGVGNIAVTQGDIYLGAANGVLNAGGGLMASTINYIGDAFVAPTIVNGDEDLYIGDDLELGSQGFKPGGGVWGTASDRRLKENIQPYSDGLASLLKINPVTFKYNNVFKTLDTGKTYVGIIAQEIEEIAPYMVSSKPFGQVVEEDENGHETIISAGEEYLTFDGSALTYMLINSIKEINEDKKELQNENAILKNEIESQKAILQNILKRLESIENKNNN